MIRIGLVDLDTSHPRAFTNILRTIPGVDVTALWDGGDVWPRGYDRRFAGENGIPAVCASLEEMPELVDAAMLHGVNWERHIERALVFMKTGKSVLIDKPVVGSVRDCDRLENLMAKYGTQVYGGSALRCVREVAALRAGFPPGARVISVAASGPGDFFSYGVHTTELLQGFAGTGIRKVTPVVRSGCPVIALEYRDGLTGILHLQTPFSGWSLTAYTTEGVRTAVVNPEGLYEPFLRGFVAMLRGEKGEGGLAGPLEAVRVHLAARTALRRGAAVSLDDIPPRAAFDGRAFASAYAAEKRRGTSGVPRR